MLPSVSGSLRHCGEMTVRNCTREEQQAVAMRKAAIERSDVTYGHRRESKEDESSKPKQRVSISRRNIKPSFPQQGDQKEDQRQELLETKLSTLESELDNVKKELGEMREALELCCQINDCVPSHPTHVECSLSSTGPRESINLDLNTTSPLLVVCKVLDGHCSCNLKASGNGEVRLIIKQEPKAEALTVVGDFYNCLGTLGPKRQHYYTTLTFDSTCEYSELLLVHIDGEFIIRAFSGVVLDFLSDGMEVNGTETSMKYEATANGKEEEEVDV